MAENAKHSGPRIVSALVVLALAGDYVVQIVRGRIVGEHRLGTNDTIIVALALFVSVLLLYPEMLGRLSRLELPGLKVTRSPYRSVGRRPAKDLPPKAIWESMQKLGIIVPKP